MVRWDQNVQKRRKKGKHKFFGHATCGRGMSIARSNRTKLDQAKVTYSIRCESLSESEISTSLSLPFLSFLISRRLPGSLILSLSSGPRARGQDVCLLA